MAALGGLDKFGPCGQFSRAAGELTVIAVHLQKGKEIAIGRQ